MLLSLEYDFGYQESEPRITLHSSNLKSLATFLGYLEAYRIILSKLSFLL